MDEVIQGFCNPQIFLSLDDMTCHLVDGKHASSARICCAAAGLFCGEECRRAPPCDRPGNLPNRIEILRVRLLGKREVHRLIMVEEFLMIINLAVQHVYIGFNH